MVTVVVVDKLSLSPERIVTVAGLSTPFAPIVMSGADRSSASAAGARWR